MKEKSNAKILIEDIQPDLEDSLYREIAIRFGVDAAMELIGDFRGATVYTPLVETIQKHANIL